MLYEQQCQVDQSVCVTHGTAMSTFVDADVQRRERCVGVQQSGLTSTPCYPPTHRPHYTTKHDTHSALTCHVIGSWADNFPATAAVKTPAAGCCVMRSRQHAGQCRTLEKIRSRCALVIHNRQTHLGPACRLSRRLSAQEASTLQLHLPSCFAPRAPLCDWVTRTEPSQAQLSANTPPVHNQH